MLCIPQTRGVRLDSEVCLVLMYKYLPYPFENEEGVCRILFLLSSFRLSDVWKTHYWCPTLLEIQISFVLLLCIDFLPLGIRFLLFLCLVSPIHERRIRLSECCSLPWNQPIFETSWFQIFLILSKNQGLRLFRLRIVLLEFLPCCFWNLFFEQCGIVSFPIWSGWFVA